MKVKINKINVDKKSGEVDLSIVIMDDKGRVVEKGVSLKLDLKEYSKENVLSLMRQRAVEHSVASRAPARPTITKIKKELDGLELNVKDEEIGLSEVRSGSPPDLRKPDNEEDASSKGGRK